MKVLLLVLILFGLGSCAPSRDQGKETASVLVIRENADEGTFSVFRKDGGAPLLVQHAKGGVRPYIHPILAPDGKGELTEYSPAHHKHQTGIYWGLKQVNGRDYFMNWKADYWRKADASVLTQTGRRVAWRTRYDLLDEHGTAILTETQTWHFQDLGEKYVMDLEWRGEAKNDVTMGKFYVGGLFLRMPWHKDIRGEVINAAGQRNGEAEGERAIWNDIGIQVPGRDDMAHIAIMDHPDNNDFPIPWRVDNELGVGPSRQILGDWTIPRGQTEVIRYRFIVYTGELAASEITSAWKEYVCE